MELKLKIVQGKNTGQEVAITGQKFLIGRAEDCHMRPGSDMISRHHCAIVVDQSFVAVRDFGSKNGTYVNGERVIGECELKSGDQLRVGPLEFEISLKQGELGGKKKPPVHSAKEAAERTAQGLPDDPDVSHWLADPAADTRGVSDSQIVASKDTQSIRLTETEQISLSKTRTFAGSQPAAEPVASPEKASSQTMQMQAGPAAATPAAVTPAGRSGPMPVVRPASAVHAATSPTAVAAARPVTPPTVASTAVQPAAAQPAAVTPAASASAAAKPAPVAPAAPAAKHAGPSVFQMPQEEQGPAQTPDSDKSASGSKKVYGKLPPRQGAQDSRSAASEVLDKLRKRR
jgi:pSer/pThr/pTyr-binding forkhead associated (FHA) protein